MGRKYGISTISLVPYSFGTEGFKNSLDIAIIDLGLSGIQALPMRGWSNDRYHYSRYLGDPLDKIILSFEGPWNSGSVWQAFARTLGSKKEGYPTFLDLYLFGRNPMPVLKAMDNVFGWEKYISYTINSGYRYMVEIGPDNVQIQNYVDYRHGLVWDTCHTREKGMPDWKELLSALSSESIKLIHFHPKDEGELAQLIGGWGNELADMLDALRLKVSPDCPVILETRPKIGFVSRKSMIKRLSLIRDTVCDILG